MQRHEEYPSPGSELKEQILCTTLRLSASSGTDYLIIGVGTLRGAHIVPFWIVHESVNGPEVLFKTRSDALTILSSTHNGYSIWNPPGYSAIGSRQLVITSMARHISDSPQKKHAIECHNHRM